MNGINDFGIVFLRIFGHWNSPPTPSLSKRGGKRGERSSARNGMFINGINDFWNCVLAHFRALEHTPNPSL